MTEKTVEWIYAPLDGIDKKRLLQEALILECDEASEEVRAIGTCIKRFLLYWRKMTGVTIPRDPYDSAPFFLDEETNHGND